MIYSPSAKGFFEPGFEVPVDGIEVTDEKYNELLNGQNADNEITVVDDEVVLAPRVITPEEQRYRTNSRIYAQLAAIDAKKIRAVTDALLSGDTARLVNLEQQALVLRSQIIVSGG